MNSIVKIIVNFGVKPITTIPSTPTKQHQRTKNNLVKLTNKNSTKTSITSHLNLKTRFLGKQTNKIYRLRITSPPELRFLGHLFIICQLVAAVPLCCLRSPIIPNRPLLLKKTKLVWRNGKAWLQEQTYFMKSTSNSKVFP